MSEIEETRTHNTMRGNVHGNVVQSGSMRDLHLHSSSLPTHRDPKLFTLGTVALAAGLGLLVVVLALCAWILWEMVGDLSAGGGGPFSARGVLGLMPPVGGVVAVLLVGFLAINQLWTAWDLMGRRHHAWRQDAFAGQSSLWLTLLVPALVLSEEVPAVLVPFGLMAVATVAAAVLTCTGGARRRASLVVAASVAAAGWFGPVLWVLWRHGESLPVQVVGTLVVLVGMAVPVLAVTAMPAACGAVVLRGWVLGVVFAVALFWAGVSTRSSSPVNLLAPVFISTACVVVLALVVSGLLGRNGKRAA
ncbi:hypothetical protein ACWGE0_24770 [Lentzea sp. NPDC054927]